MIAYRKRIQARKELSREWWSRRAKMFGAYIAFVAALMVAVATTDANLSTKSTAVSLLAISLPFLVATVAVDFIIIMVQDRHDSATRGLFVAGGFLTSFAGIGYLVGAFSWTAAWIFWTAVLVGALLVARVGAIGKLSGNERL
jgi:hypothetical protein